MLKLLFLSFCTLTAAISNAQQAGVRKSLPLAGEWKFRIDSLDQGITGKWYDVLADDSIKLPGSMTENGKGDEISARTPWTGDIIDSSYFKLEKYSQYRRPGNIKIPFWLKPAKYYKGVAWYQKEFDLPSGWLGKNLVLFLERCHWQTTVYVNGKMAGSFNSLEVPHEYDITEFLVGGKNRISIRIDNRVLIPIGSNSHSISDHTQTNWNGIIGDISLKAIPNIFISNVAIYPEVREKRAKVIIDLTNKTGKPFKGELALQAKSFNTPVRQRVKEKLVPVAGSSRDLQLIIDYPMGDSIQLWNEFTPALYKLSVTIRNSGGTAIDHLSADFGMREFKANGKKIEVNGQQGFIRGTSESCTFPLTGYPPHRCRVMGESARRHEALGIE